MRAAARSRAGRRAHRHHPAEPSPIASVCRAMSRSSPARPMAAPPSSPAAPRDPGDGVTSLGTTLTLKLLSEHAGLCAAIRHLQPSHRRSLAGGRRVQFGRRGARGPFQPRGYCAPHAAASIPISRPVSTIIPCPSPASASRSTIRHMAPRFDAAGPTMSACSSRRCSKASPASRRWAIAASPNSARRRSRRSARVGGGAANEAWTQIREGLLAVQFLPPRGDHAASARRVSPGAASA